ncbi:asparagine synthetase B family protein [Halorussus halophilus]|uniref:hypothetical protein n=1 Tax=Halorussus halophilus TaxID=2650975 RepID=UPI00130163B6|nr:hypothetical protein [Halorussus halophilus]
MNKEIFGVFGDTDLSEIRTERAFDAVVSGPSMTVAVRDPALGIPGRSAVYEDERGCCLVWGEAFSAADGVADTAEWFFERYAQDGRAAFSELNGSYLACVDYEGDAVVATDPIRSWECFYTDATGVRTFGSDIGSLRSILDEPSVDRHALLEFLHLGTVLGERTVFDQIRRVPFDGYLTPAETAELDRFVYDPCDADEFDHVGELADRLRSAIARRSHYPGTKGLLLSAGQDSRTLLSQIPDIERCYTLGRAGSQEVDVAERLAEQYGSDHEILEPCRRYLFAAGEKVRYSQGIKESLHIHHAAYDVDIELDTMYHGLLYDTLFKGYFLQEETLDVLGLEIPLKRLDDNPRPIDSLLDTLGFLPDGSDRLADCVTPALDSLGFDADLEIADPEAFLEDSLRSELRRCWSRADSVHNLMDVLIIRNQPALPFRVHLADNYLEAFVTIDSELLDWHLRTPPELRNRDTVRAAIRRLDDDIYRHRPPDKPYDSHHLNQIERFARRKLPFFDSFDPAWPDRRKMFHQSEMGERLFPDATTVQDLPPRQQLRVNDLRWWFGEPREKPT